MCVAIDFIRVKQDINFENTATWKIQLILFYSFFLTSSIYLMSCICIFIFFGKTPSLSPFGLQKIIENIKQKCVEDIKTENWVSFMDKVNPPKKKNHTKTEETADKNLLTINLAKCFKEIFFFFVYFIQKQKYYRPWKILFDFMLSHV